MSVGSRPDALFAGTDLHGNERDLLGANKSSDDRLATANVDRVKCERAAD